MNLTKIQQRAVDEIFNKYKSNIKEVIFKAPTGSGKTFMAANLISKIIEDNSNKEKICFVVATLSSAELPLQMKNKFDEYQAYLPIKFTSRYEESPSKKLTKYDTDIKILPGKNEVIILGKSSFGKDCLFITQGTFNSFIDQIKTQNYKLIYIRDEAHTGSNKTTQLDGEPKKFENMVQGAATFILKMTATPKTNDNLVLIDENELNDDETGQYLLKTNGYFNASLSEYDTVDDKTILSVAIEKFKKIKNEYQADEESKLIQPAMLIQLDNKIKGMEKKWEECYDMIKNQLKISGLSYCVYFGQEKWGTLKEKVTLKSISNRTSGYDVIIFKVGPATGWDIPRACMLVQLRNVSSSVLNTQTIGRIKRNPNLGLGKNQILDKYYVYSNYQESTRNMYHYSLQQKYLNDKFPSVRLKVDKIKQIANEKKFNKYVGSELKKSEDRICENIKEFFHSPYFLLDIDVIKMSSDGKTIKNQTKIFNSIQFEMEIRRLINSNKKIFSIIENTLKTNFLKNKEKKISFYHYFYEVYKFLWSKFIKYYTECFYEKNKTSFEIQDHTLPKSYQIWSKRDEYRNDILIDFKDCKDIYLYECVGKKENSTKQALDSEPEVKFMKDVIQIIRWWVDDGEKSKITAWAKNPALSNNVYVEYLAPNQIDISKAFLDFIIKIKNKFLYIEVKSENDYDEKKTEAIQKSFNNLTKEIKNDNLFFAIAKVDLQGNVNIDKVITSNKKFQNKANQSLTKIIKNIFDIK